MSDLQRWMAIHEAGHAVVAMALGKNMHEARIDGAEGGYSLNYWPARWRSWHACSALGGVFACAIHCRDCPDFADWNSWQWCHEDLRLFNAERGGMTFRQGRRLTLGILREREAQLLELAGILERDGYVNYANAPAAMRWVESHAL